VREREFDEKAKAQVGNPKGRARSPLAHVLERPDDATLKQAKQQSLGKD